MPRRSALGRSHLLSSVTGTCKRQIVSRRQLRTGLLFIFVYGMGVSENEVEKKSKMQSESGADIVFQHETINRGTVTWREEKTWARWEIQYIPLPLYEN